jgi:Tat pathway signal sequence domain protein
MQNALKWILENKQSAAQIGAQYLPAPEPALANAFERSNLTVTKAKDLTDELMSFFEVLFELNPKLLGGKMPDKSLFL